MDSISTTKWLSLHFVHQWKSQSGHLGMQKILIEPQHKYEQKLKHIYIYIDLKHWKELLKAFTTQTKSCFITYYISLWFAVFILCDMISHIYMSVSGLVDKYFAILGWAWIFFRCSLSFGSLSSMFGVVLIGVSTKSTIARSAIVICRNIFNLSLWHVNIIKRKYYVIHRSQTSYTATDKKKELFSVTC